MKDKYLGKHEWLIFLISKIQNMKWKEMGEFERIKAIYNYVRDDVLFGYNIDDGISAQKYLQMVMDNVIQKELYLWHFYVCNIPCRVHGFTIDKRLQKGAMTGFVYRNAEVIFHS